jgi:predicted GTPase
MTQPVSLQCNSFFINKLDHGIHSDHESDIILTRYVPPIKNKEVFTYYSSGKGLLGSVKWINSQDQLVEQKELPLKGIPQQSFGKDISSLQQFLNTCYLVPKKFEGDGYRYIEVKEGMKGGMKAGSIHCSLIREKIENPTKELSIEDSIHLLTTCIEYGEREAQKIENKQAIIVIGNTGAGKSTFVNYLYGCEFETVDPEDVGLSPEKCLSSTILSVKKSSPKQEVMKIGHTNKSETFMPEIIIDDQGLTYCDCPGFLDNRGAEINIANAINIKTTLKRATGIKVVILINRNSLFADRGRGFKEMIDIACHLFGSRENLLNHKNAILLGVTQLEEASKRRKPQDLEVLKKKIAETEMGAFDQAALKELAECLFIYDPLNETNLEYYGSLQREEIIEKIASLKPIEKSGNIFQTVLSDSDEKKLIQITETIQKKVEESLEKKEFEKAALLLRKLNPLQILDHPFVTKMLSENQKKIETYFFNIVIHFKDACLKDDFQEGEKLLKDLEEAQKSFGEDIKIADLLIFRKELEDRKNRKVIEKEKNALQEKIETFKRQCTLENFLQAEKTLEELQKFPESFIKSYPELQSFRSEIQSLINHPFLMTIYQEHKKRYDDKEKKRILKIKIETFNQCLIYKDFDNARRELDQIKQNYSVAKEIPALESRFLSAKKADQEQLIRLEVSKQEKSFDTLLKHQSFSEAMDVLNNLKRYEPKYLTVEASILDLQFQKGLKNQFYFGKAKWEKYFGDIGVEPSLPANIEQILNSPCPFHKDTGKKVRETHLLVLVPEKVNGKSFCLDSLSDLIKSPKSGHQTQYRYYDSDVKKELGTQSMTSHWALMTRDVIPDSRSKTYEDQKALVQKHAQSSQIPYELPKALEAATVILMHHVETGERLYPDSPLTYTRCQEKVNNNQWPAAIGGFSSGGLRVNYRCHDDLSGVGACRKF